MYLHCRMNNQHGFTVMELILSIVLTALVLMVGYYILSSSNLMLNKVSDRADIHESLNTVMTEIQNELRLAIDVKIASDLTDVTGTKVGLYMSSANAKGEKELLKKIGSASAKPATLVMPIPGLSMSLLKVAGKNNVIQVNLTTTKGYSLQGQVVTANDDVVTGIVGNVAVFTPAS